MELTIGVTCYNYERYVRSCIDSVLAQTYPHVEVIVVDDSSTDGTLQIVESYGDRIHLIRHEQNSGSLVQGRLDVMGAARGDFVHHIDADDTLDPRFAEMILGVFQGKPHLDWVSPSVNVIDAEGKVTKQWDYLEYGFSANVREALLRGWRTASLAVPLKGVFKMSFLRQNNLSWYRLPNTVQGEDAFTCLKYLEADPSIEILRDRLVNYRIHGENMSTVAEERTKMVVDLLEYYVSHFNEMLYIPHPGFMKVPYGSDEYLSLKYFLIAARFGEAKRTFSVPPAFAMNTTPDDLAEAKKRFDEPLRRYANLSLEYGTYYEREVEALLEGS